MSQIDAVRSKVDPRYFNQLSGPSYVRVLDTPRIWGLDFGPGIMEQARKRTRDFERAIVEIIQKSKFRCDVASLNSPDPEWAKVILGAMDAALTEDMGRTKRTQFRFLFGQTPMLIMNGTAPPLIDFQGALIRLVRARTRHWKKKPEIWMGKFYRLREGLLSGLYASFASSLPSWLVAEGDDDFTKMTWNHSKIIAVDGAESLVGGHNLNMDLFTSYPPVHDVSVVMHGEAALGAQLFLNKMWECGTDVFTKEYLDVDAGVWKNGDDVVGTPWELKDPLIERDASDYRDELHEVLARLHGGGGGEEVESPKLRSSKGLLSASIEDLDEDDDIRRFDLQGLDELELPVFKEKKYASYAGLGEYKKATRVLSVGKYWKGSSLELDYEKASELMKEELIKGAKRVLRLSQMDLVSAWKKKWSSHVVCHWIMEALLANEALVVQVVVSPLDAGAGAEGDQYSFGSGACRTFELFKYYMTHAVDTDTLLPDADVRERALERLHIAPLYFTEVPDESTTEGETYFWPELSPAGFTATLKQPSLTTAPPDKGIIGSAFGSVQKASALRFPKVPSAPGNHAKIMIVDDESYVVGSDNLYPGFLSEFNYLVEGESAVKDLLESYWEPLWDYSGRHCVNPGCAGGCKTRQVKPKPRLVPSMGFGMGVYPSLFGRGMGSSMLLGGLASTAFFGKSGLPMSSGKGGSKPLFGGFGGGLDASLLPPLMSGANLGKVKRLGKPSAPENLDALHEQDEAIAMVGMVERELAKEVSPLPISRPSSPKAKKKDPERESNGDKIEGTHYYTDRQIYRLMQHYIGHMPNVFVRHGINGHQLSRLGPNAFDDVLADMSEDSEPRVIVMPYNVQNNHWGLFYIKVSRAALGGRREVRVLYIDPLNPMMVPPLGPLLRPFPELLVERCTITYQNDNYGGREEGQHSCGPWIVHLSRCLVHSEGALPQSALDPRQAAKKLRTDHQQVLNDLNQQSRDFL
ncbi:hypothetical protein HUW62_25735 [Myxococcus sp. AM011]|uniref:hypothetical protein n=1 Tax=Myxococcus sp. AM011 TaxID=2745200 RepID=UPI001595A6E6|nr:hypothetical protein [Myxococcus sp. AM011]NVJ24634.1 hypothetical protein [Myxococcus sp. AM011]